MYNSSELVFPPAFIIHQKKELHGYLVGVFLGGIVAILTKRLNVPIQISSVISGIILGVAARYIGHFEEVFVDSHLLQSLYTALLVAKLVLNIDHYLIIKSCGQIIVIVAFGCIGFVVIFGLAVSFFEKDTQVSIVQSMIISVMIAPNDNPEVPISDGTKNLQTLMYGETILGIAFCNIARIILTGYIHEIVNEWYQYIAIAIRYIALSIPIGCGFGWLLSFLYRELYNDGMNAVAAYLSASFFVYIFCEHVAWCNGMIGSFFTLVIMNTQRRRFFSKTDLDVKMCCNVIYTIMYLFVTIFCIAESIYSLEFDDMYKKILIGISIYIVANVIRLVLLLIASPILSRIGYGFEFSSLLTIFWAVQKGPLQLFQVIKLNRDDIDFASLETFRLYVLVYVILTSFVNGTSLKVFFKAFGVVKLSSRRKANISANIKLLNETGSKVLASLKRNQYYSDVNWAIINTHTTLHNPYQEFSNLWTKDNVICNICRSPLPLKPTREEYNEHLKDVAIKVLKAQRVSFLEQHAIGLMEKQDVEFLLQAIDIAMDSTNMKINVDRLLSCMDSKNAYILSKRARKLLTIDSKIKIPKTKHRRNCYRITNSLAFEAVMFAIAMIDIINIVLRLIYQKYMFGFTILPVTTLVCYFGYIAGIVLRILSYENGSCANVLKYYWGDKWNKLNLFVVVITFGDCVIATLLILNINISPTTLQVNRYVKSVIVVKLLPIFVKLYPFLVEYLERRNEVRLMRAFGVAQGIVISCDEVISTLPSLTEKSNIRDVIKMDLEQTRSRMTQRMGLLEKARPSLATTIKTKQSLRCLLKHLNEGLHELRGSGLIDAFEYKKLHLSVIEKNKFLAHVKILEVIQPTLIFNEISWLRKNDAVSKYIYAHIQNKIFNAGDILCKPGDPPEGVYIIIAGYFKVTYYPTPELIGKLKENGVLPIKEFLEYLRFDELQEDYLSCGNRMGEFAVLTNRPHNCLIVADAPSQIFIIPRRIIVNAQEKRPDPVLGLCARMWKSVFFGLGRRLLSNTGTYKSTKKIEADYELSRAVVPNTDYYNIINLTSAVEDVILLDGIVVDYETREIYVAPLILPKQVKRLCTLRSQENIRKIHTKLMFVPSQNIDEYDMMLGVQNNSDLVDDHGCVIASHEMNAKRRFENNVLNLNKPKSGTTSYCHTVMAYNSGLMFYVNDE